MKNLLFLLFAFVMSTMTISCENQNNQSSAQNKPVGTNIDCTHDLLAEYRCSCGGKLKHSFRAISYEKSCGNCGGDGRLEPTKAVCTLCGGDGHYTVYEEGYICTQCGKRYRK